MKRLLISGAIILASVGAGLKWYGSYMDDSLETATGAAFFESPEQAVKAISRMLTQEDWTSLARYYDLDGSGIDREDLVSGEFFIRTERPEVAHPGGFWRYKHPFAPSFEFVFTSSAREAGVVIVRVGISIDQGSGSPMQRGWQEFSMRESEAGFQILPNNAEPMDMEILLTPPDSPTPEKPDD